MGIYLLLRQQFPDCLLHGLALRRLAQPFPELAAGYGDGYLAPVLAQLSQLSLSHKSGLALSMGQVYV